MKMGVVTVGELKTSISGKRSFRPSSTIRHAATEWPISDVSSDVTIEIGSSSFALHKVIFNLSCCLCRWCLKDVYPCDQEFVAPL